MRHFALALELCHGLPLNVLFPIHFPSLEAESHFRGCVLRMRRLHHHHRLLRLGWTSVPSSSFCAGRTPVSEQRTPGRGSSFRACGRSLRGWLQMLRRCGTDILVVVLDVVTAETQLTKFIGLC